MFPETDIDGTIRVEAAAKINLYLEVLSKKDDGYHEIRSVLVPISLCDSIRIELTDGVIETRVVASDGVDRDAVQALCDGDNLATRAALALRERTGHDGGARIVIDKRIPIGGGLGGGSADAAGVLTALNLAWGSGLALAGLADIGATLGCDVPALLCGGAVQVAGVGERVTPIPAFVGCAEGPWWGVIANPGISVSTRDIYSRLTSSLTSEGAGITTVVSALAEGDLESVSRGLFNGLQETVFKKYPVIEMLAERLLEAGALSALVSGSGATVFGLARGREDAEQIAAGIAADGEGTWCRVFRTLPDGVM
ncbi:MAG: 4-(cytidine 5'-diphospho)-2-C-methyl-D-erythritol kinase, partial [Lentisphaerae bacterium]|nr:4-(cytidine 5'-diphospho)-2-C-methyl-D-erythritol kinase [Lentisphaerota bacterium]